MTVQSFINGAFDPECVIFVASSRHEESGSEDEAESVVVGWCHGGTFYRTTKEFGDALTRHKETQERLLKDYNIPTPDWSHELHPAVLITANKEP